MFRKGFSDGAFISLVCCVIVAVIALCLWLHTPTDEEKKFNEVRHNMAPALSPDKSGKILSQNGTLNYDIVTLPTGDRIALFSRFGTAETLSAVLLPPLPKAVEQ